VLRDGQAAFNPIQDATDTGDASLVFFVFDLLHLDGEDITGLPSVDRKTRLEAFLVGAAEMLRHNDHQIGQGPTFYLLACQHGLEGIVSKRVDGPYEPDRRTWAEDEAREPRGLRRRRVQRPGGQPASDRRLAPGLLRSGRQVDLCGPGRHRDADAGVRAPLAAPSPARGHQDAARCPTTTRWPLVLNRVHWVRPEMVVEVTFAEWTPDGLLRHVVYLGEREDKPAIEVRRDQPK
jgi:bifunctional non-homologous end joining protein LigD